MAGGESSRRRRIAGGDRVGQSSSAHLSITAPQVQLIQTRSPSRSLSRSLLRAALAEFESAGGWVPRVDLSETKHAVVATAEIPGVEQKDVNVSLHEQVLTIKVEKHWEKEEKEREVPPGRTLFGCLRAVLPNARCRIGREGGRDVQER